MPRAAPPGLLRIVPGVLRRQRTLESPKHLRKLNYGLYGMPTSKSCKWHPHHVYWTLAYCHPIWSIPMYHFVYRSTWSRFPTCTKSIISTQCSSLTSSLLRLISQQYLLVKPLLIRKSSTSQACTTGTGNGERKSVASGRKSVETEFAIDVRDSELTFKEAGVTCERFSLRGEKPVGEPCMSGGAGQGNGTEE